MNYYKSSTINYGNLTKGYIYFIQRFEELLFNYTLDSYKPMALNAPSLCVEAISTISEIKRNNINIQNIQHILDELESVLVNDFIAKELIMGDVKYYLNYNENITLDDLSHRLSLLERSLERYRYFEKTLELLVSSINSDQLKHIDYLSKNLITLFTNWNINKEYLHNTYKLFFYNGDRIEDNGSINNFLELIRPVGHRFSVYFKVSNSILKHKDAFRNVKMKLIDVSVSDNSKIIENCDKIYYRSKRGFCLIEVSGNRAADPYTAKIKAEKKLSILKNITQLYHHNSTFSWSNEAIVYQECCGKTFSLVKNELNPMITEKNCSPVEVVKQTNWLFQNISLSGESYYRFNRAIELHSNSVHNLKTENQLVNMWTIFETLIPQNNKTSKIKSIIDSVTPILLLKYYSRILQNLFIDIYRWNEEVLESILDEVEEGQNYKEKLLYLFCDSKYDEQIKKLYTSLDDFHLLRFRIFNIKSVISNKDKILKNLERHKKNVVWQFHRIYRTRNLIVHSGVKSSYISTLISNAHNYIDQVLFEVIDLTTSSYHVNTLEEAFGITELKYKELFNTIKQSKDFTEYINLLKFE